MDDDRLTLAFDLVALRRVADPAAVVADAVQWSEHVGVVTDRAPHVLTKFTRDHGVTQDFSPDPVPAVETLEHMREHFDTGRYVHVGTKAEHQLRADTAGWEFLNIEEAANEAGWDLATVPEHPESSRLDTSTDDWP